MRKFRLLAASAIAAVCLAQTASELESEKVNRVAEKLACPCGCTLNMACKMQAARADSPGQMTECGTCSRAKHKIAAMQATGKNDQAILDSFVAENGKQILFITPGVFGTAGPYIALGLGMFIVVFTINRMRRRPAPAGPAAEIDPAIMERIDKDMAKLD